MSARVSGVEESASRPKSRRECRTFGDLMAFREPSEYLAGCCKRCGAYGHVNNWHYSTRASICEPCAIKAKDELLPWVATAERRARSWIKKGLGGGDAKFLASLTGASVEYIQAEMRRQASTAAHLKHAEKQG